MSNGTPGRSLLSRLGAGVRGALSSIGSAFRRGLDTLGVTSLLRRAGIAARGYLSPPVIRTASGAPMDPAEREQIRTARELILQTTDAEDRQLAREVELVNLAFQAQIHQTEELRALDTLAPVPRDILVQAMGRQRRAFAYIVKWWGVKRESGEPVAGTVTITSDENLPPGEAEQTAKDLIEDSLIEVLGTVLVNVFERSAVA